MNFDVMFQRPSSSTPPHSWQFHTFLATCSGVHRFASSYRPRNISLHVLLSVGSRIVDNNVKKGTRKELQQKEWIKWRPEEGCFLHHSSVASAAQFVVELSGEKETDRSPADAKWEMESILRCIFFFSLARYIGRERKIPSSLH